MSERNWGRLFRGLIVFALAAWIVQTWFVGRAV